MTRFDFAGRLQQARALLSEEDLSALLLSVGSDLPYFTGYEAPPLERLTMFVLTEDVSVLVVPELEAPRVTAQEGLFETRPWSETEDPVDIVVGVLGIPARVALGDTTWSTFTLALQAALPATEFSDAGRLTRHLRIVKDQQEIELLVAAAQAADRAVTRLSESRFSGRTEREIARLTAELALAEGHEWAGEPIVASGPNGASPHHEPTDRVIERGDVVVVDFGGTIGGYHSDTTRTFCIGEPPAQVRKVHSVVLEAQQRGMAAVGPGVSAQTVDRAARRVIDEAGYGDFFIHRTGHGIGLDIHEHPYLVQGNDVALEPGMTFSIEPGIYLPNRFGIRIEDIVFVDAAGARVLNRSSRDLYIVS